jgi:glycyl-tRNA synthetase beta chain
VPTAPVTVAVSLADKLDSLVGFFFYKEVPTGSKDPFALRRAALAVVRLLIENGVKISILAVSDFAIGGLEETWKRHRQGTMALGLAIRRHPVLDEHEDTGFRLLDFFADRLKVQQREASVRHDLIDAVFALGGEDDLVRLLARVRALQSFVETPEGRDLLAGYKRAANILKKEGWGGASRVLANAENDGIPQTGEEDPLVLVDDPDLADAIAAFNERHPEATLSYTPLDEEQKLIAALDSAEPRARAAIEAEDFEGAMAALASLRAPVDAFFDKVTVNDPDHDKREARLNLLARMRDAVHEVADFSRIEG